MKLKEFCAPGKTSASPRGRGVPRIPPLEGMWAPSEAGAAFTDVENEVLGLESQPERQCMMRTPTSLRIFFSTTLSGTVHKQGQGAHGEVKGNSPSDLRQKGFWKGFRAGVDGRKRMMYTKAKKHH